jgi:hypothetical protein
MQGFRDQQDPLLVGLGHRRRVIEDINPGPLDCAVPVDRVAPERQAYMLGTQLSS